MLQVTAARTSLEGCLRPKQLSRRVCLLPATNFVANLVPRWSRACCQQLCQLASTLGDLLGCFVHHIRPQAAWVWCVVAYKLPLHKWALAAWASLQGCNTTHRHCHGSQDKHFDWQRAALASWWHPGPHLCNTALAKKMTHPHYIMGPKKHLTKMIFMKNCKTNVFWLQLLHIHNTLTYEGENQP